MIQSKIIPQGHTGNKQVVESTSKSKQTLLDHHLVSVRVRDRDICKKMGALWDLNGKWNNPDTQA